MAVAAYWWVRLLTAEQLRLLAFIGCSFRGCCTLNKKSSQVIEVAILLPALTSERTKDLLPEPRSTRQFMVTLVLCSYLIIHSLEIPDLHLLSLACSGKSSCIACVLANYIIHVSPLVLIRCRKVTNANGSKKAVKMMHLQMYLI